MSRLLNLLFPPRCSACGALLSYRVEKDEGLCPSCREAWDRGREIPCPVCRNRVSRCDCMPPLMQRAGCAGLFKCLYYTSQDARQVQNRVIYAVKNRGDARALDFLAGEVAEVLQRQIREKQPEQEELILTYIPRSRRAIRQYGVDQARQLAQRISLRCGIPMVALLRRMPGQDRPQKRMNAREREANAARSYGILPGEEISLRGKTVLLVDDIVTTGASMASCTRLLRRMKAERIYGLSVLLDEFIPEG